MIGILNSAGFGSIQPKIIVTLGKRPPMECYQTLKGSHCLAPGEISLIGQQTGNHWRKIFNCLAKVAYRLDQSQAESWQDYRDQHLLQEGSPFALWFDYPQYQMPITAEHEQLIKIICGRSYAQQLLEIGIIRLSNNTIQDADFTIDHQQRIMIAPYLDYRQLSNQKIEKMVNLLLPWWREANNG